MIGQATALAAGAAGLFALYRRLRQEFSTAAASLTAALIAGATSLLWSMTQATSPADAVVFAVVAALAGSVSPLTSRAVRILAWSVIAALPPVVVWATTMPVNQTTVPLAGDPLFSSARGFFALTPIAYIATVGLVFYARRNAAVGVPSLIVTLVWMVASWLLITSARGPFDHGLTAALALAAPGLAVLIEAALSRPWVAVVPVIAIFPLWNYWLMVQYTAGMLPKDEPVSFASMVRQQADVYTRPTFVYPFAFPANVLFAWREGVPIDRYELLALEPRQAQFELPMDRRGERFLIDGWGALDSAPSGPLRWTSGRTSALAFPLRRPSTDLVVGVVAGVRAEDPEASIEFALELNGREIGRASASTTPSSAQFVVPAATGREILRDGYNRLIIVNRSGRRLTPLAVHRLRIGPAS